MRQTGDYCSGYLYTHIDTEGTMSGFPFEVVPGLKAATARKLIVAGGIRRGRKWTSSMPWGWTPWWGWPFTPARMKA